jgi:predicted phage terminase large subunit-like protein
MQELLSKLNSVDDYFYLLGQLKVLPKQEIKDICRYLCKNDLYFLILYGLNRRDIAHQWLLERCREVQANPDGHLDLWARAHYKSTIITYALSIQNILNKPNVTIGIFSHTRPIAKAFLKQIKREFEGNEVLKSLFPDVLWQHPHKQAPKWSDDDGIIVKRTSNPKESTVEAWGIVDGQPTSKHFDIMVYDDVVTAESVNTPEMNKKTIARWELSLNLVSQEGVFRYIGTRYSFNDLYKVIMERKTAIPRIYPATKNGLMAGEPVFLTEKQLAEKRKSFGLYTFSSQMLQNPVAGALQAFRKEWLRFYECRNERIVQVSREMNVYILVDPASSKKKDSDYSVFAVIGCNKDKNFYLLDMVRDRLNLTERWETLLSLVKKWRPLIVGYEKYGMMADVEYIKEKQKDINYRFNIIEVGGKLAKEERIKRLQPIFQAGRFYLPFKLERFNYEGKHIKLIKQFIEEEYLIFPSSVHDDVLDGISRIEDVNYYFPEEEEDDGFTQPHREYDDITGEPL